jgi:hypothetical protein
MDELIHIDLQFPGETVRYASAAVPRIGDELDFEAGEVGNKSPIGGRVKNVIWFGPFHVRILVS